MKKRYLRGLMIPVQTALATQGELDPRQDARDYLEAHDRIPARPEWRDWELGLRAGCRMVRDHGVPGAIDLIAARLWKWGAEEELDEFLASVGMDLEGEPVPVADRPALADKIANLRLLDRNGAALITDGSLDDLSDAEVAAIIDRTIAEIRRQHAELPPIVAYEKLSGEIVPDYAEGGAR